MSQSFVGLSGRVKSNGSEGLGFPAAHGHGRGYQFTVLTSGADSKEDLMRQAGFCLPTGGMTHRWPIRVNN